MVWGALIPVIAGAVGAVGAAQQNKGSRNAAATQANAAQKGVDVQNQQLQIIQELLKPFIQGGQSAFIKQLGLLGIGGSQAENAAISEVENSPEFQAMLKQGTEGILQNASATGGLRGGNTQAALANFRPNMLSKLINDRFTRLGGVAQLGQNSAVSQGTLSSDLAGKIAELLSAQGAAKAGGDIAKGNRFGDIVAPAIGAIGGLF